MLPVRRVDCPMPKVMFRSSAAQAKAPPRVAMRLGSGKVKSTFITGSGFQMAARGHASSHSAAEPSGAVPPATTPAAAQGQHTPPQVGTAPLAEGQPLGDARMADGGRAPIPPAAAGPLPKEARPPGPPAAAQDAQLDREPKTVAHSATPRLAPVRDARPDTPAVASGIALSNNTLPCTASTAAPASTKTCIGANAQGPADGGNAVAGRSTAQVGGASQLRVPGISSAERLDEPWDKPRATAAAVGVPEAKPPVGVSRGAPAAPTPPEPPPEVEPARLRSSGESPLSLTQCTSYGRQVSQPPNGMHPCLWLPVLILIARHGDLALVQHCACDLLTQHRILNLVGFTGATPRVHVPPAATGAGPLTTAQICEHAPLLASIIPDLGCSRSRSTPAAPLPEPRRAACISALASAVLSPPDGSAGDATGCSQDIASHWLASDQDCRQQLAAACAERATSALAHSCAAIEEPAVLHAVQKLTAAAGSDTGDGPRHGEGLAELAWGCLGLWDGMGPSAEAVSMRHLLQVSAGACSLIAAAEPDCACGWSCCLAHALGDAAAEVLRARPADGDEQTARWLQAVLLSVLACSAYGCHRDARCDHGPRLVGRLLCAAAGCVQNAMGVVFAVVQCEPMGALGRQLAAQRQFWQATSVGATRSVVLRPMAAMVSVVLNVMACGACQEGRGALAQAVGAAVQVRGVSLWGWCRVGTDAITKLCAALVQLLVSAVDGSLEAGRACWAMCDEFQWLQERLGTGERCREDGQPSAVSQSSSSSGSSSDDSSCGGSEAHSGGAAGNTGEDSGQLGKLGSVHRAALSAAKEEVVLAMELAAECCGWKWTAEELVDRIVWPAVQQLHTNQSSEAQLICSCLGQLLEKLLNKIVLISDNDRIACEYVVSTREALQFVS